MHSIKGIASSNALTSGVSLQEVCNAAVPPAPHTHFFTFIAWTFGLRCAWTSFTPGQALVSVAYLCSFHVRHHMLGHNATPIEIGLFPHMLQILSCWRHFTKCLQRRRIAFPYLWTRLPMQPEMLFHLCHCNLVSFDLYYLIKCFKKCTDCLGLVLYVAWCMHMIHGASFYCAMECILPCYMTIYFHWVKVQSHYVIYFLSWSL